MGYSEYTVGGGYTWVRANTPMVGDTLGLERIHCRGYTWVRANTPQGIHLG